MSEKYCSKCGKRLPVGANFCLNCGSKVSELVVEKAKSSLLTAGVVLVLLAACVSLINAGIALIASIVGFYIRGFREPMYTTLLVAGSLALIGFVFGLLAGTQSLRRRRFAFVIVGTSSLIFTGILDYFLTITVPSGGIWLAIVLSIPTVILSLLGLIFLVTKKQESS